MTTTIDLDKLEQVARAATPGEWVSIHHSVVEANGGHLICTVDGTRGKYEYERANRDYIAAADPSAILEIVRRLRAAEENAARYLWLRDSDMLGSPSADIAFAFERYTGSRLDGVIDTAIDAARGAQGASHD